MSSEAEIILTFIYKRSGKKELKDSEIYLPLSLELGWFNNKEARSFVEHSIKNEILIEKNNLLFPNFDMSKVEIPIGFRPSNNLFESVDNKTNQDLESIILTRIGENTKLNLNKIKIEIEEIASKMNVLFIVAAAYYAKQNKVDISDLYDQIKESIFTKN